MTDRGGEKLSCVPAAVSKQSGSRSEAEEAEDAKGGGNRAREESTGVSPGSNKAAELEVTLKLLHGYRPLFPYCSRNLKGTWPLYFSLCLPSVPPTPFLILVHLAGLRADPRAPDDFSTIFRRFYVAFTLAFPCANYAHCPFHFRAFSR